MKLAVGLVEGRDSVDVELLGSFSDREGRIHPPGRYQYLDEVYLSPVNPESSFAINEVTIGIGFHWERTERQIFRGGLRIIRRDGLTAVNDVSLEEYVTSVISSEMSASCPLELLKAHAVISRSWLCFPKLNPEAVGRGNESRQSAEEIIRWYGRFSKWVG